MPTIVEITEQTAGSLRGYVRNQEQVTYLAEAIDDSVTSFDVGNGTRISAGRLSIGNEIMEVDSVSGNTVTLFPFGRGADGSTAAAQSLNSRVVANPLFPRHIVLEAVKQSVQAVHSHVPGVAQHTFAATGATYGYNLPADVDTVLSVQTERPGILYTWLPLNRYRVEKNADTTDFAGGKSLVVFDGAFPGRDVLVTYTKTTPTSLTGATDLVTGLGMRESVQDVIVYGAVARLLSMVDIALLDPSSVQSLFVDEKRQPGSAGKTVAQLWGLYRDRLDEERRLFTQDNPISVHYER